VYHSAASGSVPSNQLHCSCVQGSAPSAITYIQQWPPVQHGRALPALLLSPAALLQLQLPVLLLLQSHQLGAQPLALQALPCKLQ
jgi:hypothetical protein